MFKVDIETVVWGVCGGEFEMMMIVSVGGGFHCQLVVDRFGWWSFWLLVRKESRGNLVRWGKLLNILDGYLTLTAIYFSCFILFLYALLLDINKFIVCEVVLFLKFKIRSSVTFCFHQWMDYHWVYDYDILLLFCYEHDPQIWFWSLRPILSISNAKGK